MYLRMHLILSLYPTDPQFILSAISWDTCSWAPFTVSAKYPSWWAYRHCSGQCLCQHHAGSPRGSPTDICQTGKKSKIFNLHFTIKINRLNGSAATRGPPWGLYCYFMVWLILNQVFVFFLIQRSLICEINWGVDVLNFLVKFKKINNKKEHSLNFTMSVSVIVFTVTLHHL